MKARVQELLREGLAEIEKAGSPEELEGIRVRLLGKKGRLTQVLRQMGGLPAAERPEVGRLANEARAAIEAALAGGKTRLEATARQKALKEEALDVTLPGRRPVRGGLHPLTRVWMEIEDILQGMGFEIAEGPEVELESYNFGALNYPEDHPARDMQDSFYITPEILLRTQTSPVQVRYMQQKTPQLPVRIIAPGRVFRRDDDPTHSPMFHQVEGLLVDRGITLGDLKGVLYEFARQMFGPRTRIRFRPSYFPFTEPSAEVDVSCTVCRGEGCRTCGNTGWLEILGSGMVHPAVLENGGYDPEVVTGFAFGMGIDRITMLKYGIDDLRLFFQNDLRFLSQFR